MLKSDSENYITCISGKNQHQVYGIICFFSKNIFAITMDILTMIGCLICAWE